MDRYGEIVGKPTAWFYMEDNDEAFDYIAEAVTNVFNQVMQGATLSEAFDLVVGQGDRFSFRERQRLDAGTPGIRDKIRRQAGLPWPDLSSGDKRQVSESLIEDVLTEALREEAHGDQS